MRGNKSGIRIACQKRRMLHELLQKTEIGFDAKHVGFSDGALHAPDGLVAICAPRNELGDHRIVVDADFVARVFANTDTRVQTYIVVGFDFWRGKHMHPAGLGQEIVGGILRTNANLDRVASGDDLGLPQW